MKSEKGNWYVCKKRIKKKKAKNLYKFKECRDDYGNNIETIWVDVHD